MLHMRYKVVVLDLDGTYLNSAKEVSKRNLSAVLACCERVMRIIFATARPPRSVDRLLPQELLRVAAFVYYNGAQTRCRATRTECQIGIPAATVGEIIDACRRDFPQLALSVEAQGKWYGLGEHNYRELMRVDQEPIPLNLEELKALDAVKILLAGAYEGKPLYDCFHDQAALLYTDGGRLVQIMASGVSKEAAVRRLCQVYGVEMGTVLAFGDDRNDIGLFEACGYTVAMANAVPELKCIAGEITASNDEDGVATVLERLLHFSSTSFPL